MPVLDRQLRQSAASSVEARSVKRLDLFPEQPLRPPIRDKMMKQDNQCMVVFVKLQQLDSQQWLLLDVQGLAQRFPRLSFNGRRSLALGAGPQVEPFEPRPDCSHTLQKLTRAIEKSRSQNLMALANRGDAGVKVVNIE